jgi:starch synthase
MSGLTESEFPGIYGHRGINFPFSDLADASWAALAMADNVNTVSRRYVKETQTDEYGNGFSHLLRRRYEEGKYHGIVNGVDAFWYPSFDRHSFIEGKAQKKRETQEAFGLKPDPDALLIMMAARMDSQKGFNLVLPILEKLFTQHKINFQFVICADLSPSGGREIVTALKKLATQSEIAGRVGVITPYNKQLTKTVYAGADVSLVPSKFEPCGLVAPCSIVNGTVPIGRKVGGIADIIKNGRNGFLFNCDWPTDAAKTRDAANKLLSKIVNVYTMFQNKGMWNAFVEGLFREDHSWNQAAGEYEKLYRVTLEQFKNNGHYASFPK